MMIITNLLIRTFIYLNLIMILMTSQTLTFKILITSSKKHQDITRDAILQTTANICRSQAIQEGRNFDMPGTLTVRSVARSCYSSESIKDFQSSINNINDHNAFVDVKHFFDAPYHFDNEEILAGRELITEGRFAVKYSVKEQNYQAAREALGKILHTLQDFYSHSNWIEMGKTEPYSNLIKPEIPINNIADSETCRKCPDDNCLGNILDDVIIQQKLTTGYFGNYKPQGKCSHGGAGDLTTQGQGGINKDSTTSSHGPLHEAAASVATAATRELLQDIRAAVGDSEFLRMLGLSQTSVLCFVIDTTSSMSDDINEVRRITSSIIDSNTGTASQSSEYILVPFNDPDYGPLIRTNDPDEFKQQLNALTVGNGGDSPEMSLSGLQLALTGSPAQTQIFVFTDADAKDKWLKNTVQALIERTKSVVTFMLTNTISSRRRRSAGRADGQQLVSPQLFNSQVYQDLAQASGGSAIEVTKDTLSQATDIIAVTSRSTLVTLFQAVRNPAKAEKLSALVDTSVQNLIIYITGNSPDYTITSPSGVSQSSTELNGALGIIQKVGNFHTVQPNIADQTGWWVFDIKSTQPYSIRVVGQSEVDFLFDFVEFSQGLHASYVALNSRPLANNNVTLLMTMVGGDTIQPTEVSLIETSTSNSFNGILELVASGQYMLTFNSIPAGKFTVHVVGQLSPSRSSDNTFQRQSPTQFQTSSVNITTQPVGTMQPGTQFILPFKVATSGTGGIFNISVSNDRNFDTHYNSSITLVSGVSASGTVTLSVPENTPSGTDVTVTIAAEAPNASDFNYVVLRLSVIAPVKDIIPPVCAAVNVNANCSGNCSFSSWSFTANVTDVSGIQSVRVLKGNGTLHTTSVLSATGMNVTMVDYSSSCCYRVLELVAVDTVGNVATCFKSKAAPSLLIHGAELRLFLLVCLLFNIGISIY
ncbi:von Willebrand factor A domain-containing protein 7-like [Tachysurus vachellii]|uniref:von Willebrand factor A domain-containing protein 7-like n=1 Tax=Tachysurus vachellii TaxID=175792 RepID=UPI00296AACB4|nr:von Willebrand factor A domain-containing protein 7-like [Tachysurus vachellii]XP_060729094.1 von Willebrand factor A domain-containing protein 7-like [Tachysurus vachellii]